MTWSWHGSCRKRRTEFSWDDAEQIASNCIIFGSLFPHHLWNCQKKSKTIFRLFCCILSWKPCFKFLTGTIPRHSIIFVIVIVHDSEPNFLQICRHSMFFRSWMPGGPASQVAPRLRLHQTGGRLLAVAAPLEVPKGLRIQLLNFHLAAWFLMTYWLEHYRGHQVPIFLRVLTSMFLAHGKALLISQGILKHTGVSYTTAATTKNSHHWITDMHQCMQVKQLGKTSAPKKGDCERLRCKISLQRARSRTSSRSVCYVTSCMML